MSKPKFSTERFDVFKVTCGRRLQGCECDVLPLGAAPRDVYLAFFHSYDEPKAIATITVWPKSDNGLWHYVQWMDVTHDYRRRGVAMELLRGLEKYIGPLEMSGATLAGEKLVEKWDKEHDNEAAKAG